MSNKRLAVPEGMEGLHGASSTRNGIGVRMCQPLMRKHSIWFLQPKQGANRAVALPPLLSYTCVPVAAQMDAHMP